MFLSRMVSRRHILCWRSIRMSAADQSTSAPCYESTWNISWCHPVAQYWAVLNTGGAISNAAIAVNTSRAISNAAIVANAGGAKPQHHALNKHTAPFTLNTVHSTDHRHKIEIRSKCYSNSIDTPWKPYRNPFGTLFKFYWNQTETQSKFCRDSNDILLKLCIGILLRF